MSPARVEVKRCGLAQARSYRRCYLAHCTQFHLRTGLLGSRTYWRHCRGSSPSRTAEPRCAVYISAFLSQQQKALRGTHDRRPVQQARGAAIGCSRFSACSPYVPINQCHLYMASLRGFITVTLQQVQLSLRATTGFAELTGATGAAHVTKSCPRRAFSPLEKHGSVVGVRNARAYSAPTRLSLGWSL
jgi:hypothetical protein